MTTVTVRLFARCRDLAAADVVGVDVPTPADVAGLRRALTAAYPALAELLPRCAVAVDGDFTHDGTPLLPTSEVALLPPVSGG
jgi:molybdopterin converting factor subunit 1